MNPSWLCIEVNSIPGWRGLQLVTIDFMNYLFMAIDEKKDKIH